MNVSRASRKPQGQEGSTFRRLLHSRLRVWASRAVRAAGRTAEAAARVTVHTAGSARFPVAVSRGGAN